MREVKRFESGAGDRRLIVYEANTGSFFFREEAKHATDDYLKQLGAPDSYWAIAEDSGLYLSAEEAERGARLTLKWLRQENDK